jgi:hypothetical protein
MADTPSRGSLHSWRRLWSESHLDHVDSPRGMELAKSERNREQIIEALAALQSLVQDTEPEIVVREYHDLLDRLAG